MRTAAMILLVPVLVIGLFMMTLVMLFLIRISTPDPWHQPRLLYQEVEYYAGGEPKQREFFATRHGGWAGEFIYLSVTTGVRVRVNAHFRGTVEDAFIQFGTSPQGPESFDVLLETSSLRLTPLSSYNGERAEPLPFQALYPGRVGPHGGRLPIETETTPLMDRAPRASNHSVYFDGPKDDPCYWFEFTLIYEGERIPCGLQLCRYGSFDDLLRIIGQPKKRGVFDERGQLRELK